MFTIYFSPKRILKLTKGSTFLARGEELVEKMRRWRLPFLLAFPSLLGDLDHQHHCEDTTSPELFNAFNNRIMGIGGEEGDKAGYVPFVSHFFTLLSWYTCLFHLFTLSLFFPTASLSLRVEPRQETLQLPWQLLPDPFI